jgi:signal transduction histidine kinase
VRTNRLTTPLTWLGAAPPPWLAPFITNASDDHAEVVATSGPAEAIHQLRLQRPDALLVAVVAERTPAIELDRLQAGASLVVDGQNPDLDTARVNALIRPRRRTRSRMRALELSVSLLRVAKDEHAFMQQLTTVIADELASDRVSIMQLDPERGELVMRAAVGIPAEVVATARNKLGEGIAGVVAQTGQPIYVDDHARVRSGLVTAHELARAKPGTPMSLTVPIKSRGEVVGVVNVTDRRDGRPYGRRDISFIDYLTREVSFLLENAQLMSRLQRLMAFNESVIDTIADPLVVVDATQHITSTNQRFGQLYGPATGRQLRETMSLDDQHCAVLQRMVAGDTVKMEDRSAWPLGKGVFDVTATRFESDGQLLCLVVFRDVTDRIDRERRLVGAEKMASLGVLAAGIAHEINNPIAYVKANTRTAGEYLAELLDLVDALRAAPTDPEAAARARTLSDALDLVNLRQDVVEMTTEITEGIERVERIVRGLKSFVHPDTEKTRQASINQVVQGAILLTKGKWKHCLDIQLDLASDLPTLACLPSQLEQVFVNLIVNACQAAPDHNQLTIRSSKTEDGVRLCFEDDCGGVPAAVRDRVFEPFFTTKDVGEGSGLGLAISRNIVAGHGGRMTLTVIEGQGTRFTIDLPQGEAGRPLVVKQLSRYRV